MKGIVKTVIVCSFLLITGLMLHSFVTSWKPSSFEFDFTLLSYVTAISLFIIPAVIFVSLAYYLNKKYNESATYLNFIFTGISIIVLSSFVYHFLMMVFVFMGNNHPFSIRFDGIIFIELFFESMLNDFSLLIFGVMIVEFLITTLFFKKLKSRIEATQTS